MRKRPERGVVHGPFVHTVRQCEFRYWIDAIEAGIVNHLPEAAVAECPPRRPLLAAEISEQLEWQMRAVTLRDHRVSANHAAHPFERFERVEQVQQQRTRVDEIERAEALGGQLVDAERLAAHG